jgi:hypothetical protein
VTNDSHRWRLRPEEAVTRTVPTSEPLVEELGGVGVHRPEHYLAVKEEDRLFVWQDDVKKATTALGPTEA